MKYEIDNTERTWFVTLTLSAKARADMDRQVRTRMNLDRVHLKQPRQQYHQDRVMYEWVRDYLKRCRYHFEMHGGARLRFVAVAESHADGTPHMHLLMHTHTMITYRLLRRAKWGHGFVDARLADRQTAEYLTKYLTKAQGRVRASQWYGDSARVLAADLVGSQQPKAVYEDEVLGTPSPTEDVSSAPSKASAESSDTGLETSTGGRDKRERRDRYADELAKASRPEGLPEPEAIYPARDSGGHQRGRPRSRKPAARGRVHHPSTADLPEHGATLAPAARAARVVATARQLTPRGSRAVAPPAGARPAKGRRPKPAK